MHLKARSPSAVASVLGVLLSFVLAGQALAISWEPAVRLTQTDANGWPGSLGAAANRLHLVYRQLDADGRIIVYRRSTDGGVSWRAPVELSRPAAANSVRSSLSVEGVDIDVVWVEADFDTGTSAVWYRRSTDGGANWNAPLRVSPTTTNSQGIPAVTRSGSQVVVAYFDLATGRLYARRSLDGGALWQPRVAIGSSTLQPYEDGARDGVPALDFGTGVLYATWASSETSIVVRRSLDGGVTWGSTVTLETKADGTTPRVSAAGSQAMVTFGYFNSQVNGSARVRKTTDKGATWAPARQVSSGTRPASSQDVLRAGGKWRISYIQCLANDCSTSDGLFYRDSPDGVTWSTATRYSTTARPYMSSLGLAYHTYNGKTWTSWVGFYGGASDGDIYVRGSSTGTATATEESGASGSGPGAAAGGSPMSVPAAGRTERD